MKPVTQSLEEVVASLSPLNVDWLDDIAANVITKLAALPKKEAYDRDDIRALLDDDYTEGILCACRFAVWDRTKSGRLHPSGEGRCHAPRPEIPEIPAAFFWSTFSGTKPVANGGSISRRHPFESCPTHQPKDK